MAQPNRNPLAMNQGYQNGLDYSKTPYRTGNDLFDQIPVPGYAAGFDPNTMSMTDYLTGLEPKYSQGYNAFKEQALSKAPSNWLNMSQTQNDLKQQTQREGAQRESAGATAKALGNLASQGGLSSGARERAVEGGAKNYLGMSQDLTREGNVNDLGLQVQDQSNKLNMLGQLPGLEMGRMKNWENARDKDIGAQTEEINRLNQYNQNLAEQRRQAAAAERQAQATENAGKKGGGGGLLDMWKPNTDTEKGFAALNPTAWIANAPIISGGGGGSWVCTEVNKSRPFDKAETLALYSLRKYALKHHKKEAKFYLYDCKDLVDAMKISNTGFQIDKTRAWVETCINLVQAKHYSEAYRLYKERILDLMALYWPKGIEELRAATC